jgi:hypothetical protein
VVAEMELTKTAVATGDGATVAHRPFLTPCASRRAIYSLKAITCRF